MIKCKCWDLRNLLLQRLFSGPQQTGESNEELRGVHEAKFGCPHKIWGNLPVQDSAELIVGLLGLQIVEGTKPAVHHRLAWAQTRRLGRGGDLLAQEQMHDIGEQLKSTLMYEDISLECIKFVRLQ